MVGEIVRCILHVLFLVAGLWSLTIAPAPLYPQSLNQQWFGAYFLWMLVTANIGLTANTLIVRRGYRTRRGESVAKVLPTRDQFAAVLLRVRRLEGRGRAEESRNDAVDGRADIAEEQADIAHAHADETDTEQGVQDERLD
jgi:hypothetical protein